MSASIANVGLAARVSLEAPEWASVMSFPLHWRADDARSGDHTSPSFGSQASQRRA